MENLQKEYERIEKCAMKPEIGRYDMSQDEMLAIAKCSPNIFKTIFIAFRFGFAKGCRKTKKAVKS